MHNLIVDFIHKMPTKIKDLKNKNEEIAKFALIEESMNMGGSIAHHYYSQLNVHNYGLVQSALNNRRDFEDLLYMVTLTPTEFISHKLTKNLI